MKTLEISIRADLPDEVIEALRAGAGVSSDVELAAFLKGMYLNCLSGEMFSPDQIDVKIEGSSGEDFENILDFGGVLN